MDLTGENEIAGLILIRVYKTGKAEIFPIAEREVVTDFLQKWAVLNFTGKVERKLPGETLSAPEAVFLVGEGDCNGKRLG